MLLLEAGPPDDADEIHVPAALNLLFQTTYDWDYRTVPQERAAGRPPIYWPRGRVLGGSSSINAMIYIRGNRRDYDAWRDEYGCTGLGLRRPACPTSCGPRTTSAARRRTTAPAAR